MMHSIVVKQEHWIWDYAMNTRKILAGFLLLVHMDLTISGHLGVSW